MFDIVGIDQPCVDLSLNLAHFPKPDGREPIVKYSFQGGGKVATGLAAASLLGASCAIAGNLGRDKLADFCRRDLEYYGVDTSCLVEREGKYTSFSVVLSDRESKTRCILPHRSNGEHLKIQEIPEELLKNARYLFVPWVTKCTILAAGKARSGCGKVAIDADESTECLDDFLPLTDVFIASETLYRKWFAGSEDYEGNCRAVQKKGPEIVVFTMGQKGCFGAGGKDYFHMPAFSVDAADTLGAGDTFHGAFLAGLSKGMEAEEAARLASAAAAIKCTRIGGRAGLPDWETVQTFLNEGWIDYTKIDEKAKRYKEGFDYV